MAHLLIIHTVKEFSSWKAAFDAHHPSRKAGGCTSESVLRNNEKPNEVVMMFGWDSLANARKFTQSPDLKQAMEKAGVVGMPTIYFLD